MNIFILDENPRKAAAMQCDKHVVKMILESAQMLCTAHRILDGEETTRISKSGKKLKHWKLPDDRETGLYLATHVNHPCNLWVRKVSGNYSWLWDHMGGLLSEYKLRYGKTHACSDMYHKWLHYSPTNMRLDPAHTTFAQAMPEEFRGPDAVKAYRLYYQSKQGDFNMKWTLREQPEWFE